MTGNVDYLKCPMDECDRKAIIHDLESLRDHLRTHTYDRPWSCPCCSFRATRKATVIRHIQTLHDDTSRPIDNRSKDEGASRAATAVVQGGNRLAKHIVMATRKANEAKAASESLSLPIRGPTSERKASVKPGRNSMVGSKHSVKPSTAQDPTPSGTTSQDIAQTPQTYVDARAKVPPPFCQECSHYPAFTSVEALYQHWQEEHIGFRCSTCERSFGRQDNLDNHLGLGCANDPRPIQYKCVPTATGWTYQAVPHTNRISEGPVPDWLHALDYSLSRLPCVACVRTQYFTSLEELVVHWRGVHYPATCLPETNTVQTRAGIVVLPDMATMVAEVVADVDRKYKAGDYALDSVPPARSNKETGTIEITCMSLEKVRKLLLQD